MDKTKLIKKLCDAKDYYTAGFVSSESGDVYERFTDALVYSLDNAYLAPYEGSRLYPTKGNRFYTGGILFYDYSFSLGIDWKRLRAFPLDDDEREYIEKEIIGSLYFCSSVMKNEHNLAGLGYTHFVPDYEIFVREGVLALCHRARKSSEMHGNSFTKCAVRLAESIYALVHRIKKELEKAPEGENRNRLIRAYENFAEKGAEDIFTALACINFIFYVDGCDNIGRLDEYIEEFALEEDTEAVIRELYSSMEYTNGWNVLLSRNNKHTLVCLKAAYGLPKPNLSLAVDEYTSDEIWLQATTNNARGANPAFYNKRAYIDGYLKLGIPVEDAEKFSFGGCSESMIAGMSNSGSLDAGFNSVYYLYNTLKEHSDAESFEELLSYYYRDIEKEIDAICAEVNENSRLKGEKNPQMIRSLLVKGTLESGIEFNMGGAKYNFSNINICSLANTADSLYAIKKFVFEEKRYTLKEVFTMLESNFEGSDEYLALARSLSGFGNDNDGVDEIARAVFNKIVSEITSHKLERGEISAFLPACIMFNAVAEIGSRTPASADGRRAFTPISDSGGAMSGRDKTSPTALLSSIAKIDPSKANGTWTVNMRVSGNQLRESEGHLMLKSLLLGFFASGGVQVQITALDRETLLRALNDKELAESIIVRVGGFSARFSTLSREIQENIANRTEYA